VQLYQAQASKFTLRAPFNGVVTTVGFRRGELASSAKPAITLMGQDAMEIEAFIPEVDVAKVSVGQTIAATIDAIPSETIPGTIVYIDPAETIVDGVVSYKIRIAPSKKDARIKSGLTANITVSVLKRENVLALPNYAITETDGGAMVERVNADGESQPLPVQIGARGTNGLVEIIKGLNEGDTVIAIGLKPATP
jgi:HlyD family secretion protein